MSTTPCIDPKVPLPLELEREIFETTALMHYREIPTLLRVARRVLIWIEPLLYRVLLVTRDKESEMIALLNAIQSKPGGFFHNAVRHLCLDGNVQEEEAKRMLEVCTGIVDLGLNQHLANPTSLAMLSKLSLKRLSTSLHALFGGTIDPTHQAFTSITHLDIFDEGDYLTEICQQIPKFPKLTHVALDNGVSTDMAQTLLVQCPRLQLLLLLWGWGDFDYKSAQEPHIYDVRLVIAMYGSYWEDWEAGARGRPDFWSLGDEFVAKKRTGAIEGM